MQARASESESLRVIYLKRTINIMFNIMLKRTS
jgi:hypothetical protein